MSLYVPLMVHSETLLSKGLQLYLGLLSPFLLLSVQYPFPPMLVPTVLLIEPWAKT